MSKVAPSYKGLRPASQRASAAAKGSSKKADTRCEKLLRSTLWQAGCRFRKNVRDLLGKPDIVFTKARLIVFCDGDFWHGKDWGSRKAKLRKGTNPSYWVRKIERNMERDQQHVTKLEAEGWTVLRLWESEILENPGRAADKVLRILVPSGNS